MTYYLILSGETALHFDINGGSSYLPINTLPTLRQGLLLPLAATLKLKGTDREEWPTVYTLEGQLHMECPESLSPADK